jgi:hypothetical protein
MRAAVQPIVFDGTDITALPTCIAKGRQVFLSQILDRKVECRAPIDCRLGPDAAAVAHCDACA